MAFRWQRRAGWSRCWLYVSLCCLLQPAQRAAHETQANYLQSRNKYGEVGRLQVASMSSNNIYTEIQFCEGQRPLSALGQCGWQHCMARSLWELIGRPVIIRSSTRQEEPFSGARLPHRLPLDEHPRLRYKLTKTGICAVGGEGEWAWRYQQRPGSHTSYVIFHPFSDWCDMLVLGRIPIGVLRNAVNINRGQLHSAVAAHHHPWKASRGTVIPEMRSFNPLIPCSLLEGRMASSPTSCDVHPPR